MSTSALSKPEPIDLSNAGGDVKAMTEIQLAEQPRGIRRCYMCGSTKPLPPDVI